MLVSFSLLIAYSKILLGHDPVSVYTHALFAHRFDYINAQMLGVGQHSYCWNRLVLTLTAALEYHLRGWTFLAGYFLA